MGGGRGGEEGEGRREGEGMRWEGEGERGGKGGEEGGEVEVNTHTNLAVEGEEDTHYRAKACSMHILSLCDNQMHKLIGQ